LVLENLQADPPARLFFRFPIQFVLVVSQTPQPERETMIAKCDCQQCGQPLEFEAEHNGQFIICPECGKGTVLLLPTQTKTQTAAAPPPAKPKIKDPIESGIVMTLEGIGGAFFIIGVLGVAVGVLAVFMIASLGGNNGSQPEEIMYAVAFAVVSIAQAFIIKTLFFALAEIIRQLRRIAVK
jgi:hypothetical protein